MNFLSAALVTGGNTGIGKATASALARKGAKVVITSRDEGRGKVALDEIRSASGSGEVRIGVSSRVFRTTDTRHSDK